MAESWKAQRRHQLMEERRDLHEEAKATCFSGQEPFPSWQAEMDLLEKTENLWDHLRLAGAVPNG